MTGEDHNTDAIVAALRSPALPAEQVGEAAAVARMVEARQTATPAALSGFRSRRGVTIAAITVASLGLGGLVAAGPGIFSPAADRVEVTAPPVTSALSTESGETDDDAPSATSPENTGALIAPATEGVDIVVDADVLCADGNHGRTVSSIARSDDTDVAVADAARSNCGKPATGDASNQDAERDDDCNHGETVSSVAQADANADDRGEAVSEAAKANCNRPDDAGQPDDPGSNSNRPDDAGQPDDPGSNSNRPDDAGQPDNPGSDSNRPDDAGQPDNPGSDSNRPDDAGQPDDQSNNSGRPDDPGQPDDQSNNSGRPDDAGGNGNKP